MNRGSAIVAALVLGTFGWAYLEFQKSDAAFAKVKAFCAEIRIGDSVEVALAKAANESFGANVDLPSGEPNAKRIHFTSVGITIGSYHEEARCIVDHVDGKIVRLKAEIRDAKAIATDRR